jgi:TPR repeat protein
MRLRKLLLIILVFLFGGISLMCKSKDNDNLIMLELLDLMNMPSLRTGIPNDEFLQKMLSALSGDLEAVYEVAYYYGVGGSVYYEGMMWFTIGAENGESETQYALANMLLNFSGDDSESKTRGIFWLYTIMVKNGYRVEETEVWLDRLGYTFETAQPPDDSSFPDNYVSFSETQIAECRVGALKGNKEAALLLGKHYGEIIIDNELSEYWYRIGAQNGSPECMYEMGQILIGKDDQLDHIRGRFWLDRAAQSGYGD